MLKRKGQSILEYSIMFAVVIAVLLIMQNFVKRGYQGSLKSSSDRMGEQFSAGGTTIKEEQTMETDQTVTSEVATTGTITSVLPDGLSSKGVYDSGVYSYTHRDGVPIKSEVDSKTESARLEKARLTEYQEETVDDYETGR